MKYKVENYAKAFWELQDDGRMSDNLLVENLKKVLRRNGDIIHHKKIVKEIEKIGVRRAGGNIIDVEYARPISEELQHQIKSSFGKECIVKTKINPALIAGVRITKDGERELDQTMKRKLRKLF